MSKTLGYYLTRFLQSHLSNERGSSPNTLRSYGKTFLLFLDFMKEEKRIEAERLKITDLNKENALHFLSWLEEHHHSAVPTRNQRLAALKSFCRFLQYEDVLNINLWQEILSIKSKKIEREAVNYLSLDGIKLLLSQIPTNTIMGRRDLALISLLYETGARVQEITNLTPVDIHLSSPHYVVLYGKGRKKRIVPIQDAVIDIVKLYMEEHHLLREANNKNPLFQNAHGDGLTTTGVRYILTRYVKKARMEVDNDMPAIVSPHTLRHSKAMHLLQAGVNLVYIRDVLGHSSIQTTEIYAKADSKTKREALENAYVHLTENLSLKASWERDSELREFLKGLGK